MISFIVPAHNEQASLGRTLQAILESAQSTGQPYEVIVVDDASTDATAEIARQNGARVVSVGHRQIAATRNAGGRAAQGERLFFVDADTTVSPHVVAAALRALDKGAAGGGSPARFDRDAPLYAQLLVVYFGIGARLVGIVGGAFMFCTREAFHAVGGFDEKLFGAEDAVMCWALKREGRFVVLWRSVLTSGRRMRGLRGITMLFTLVRMGFFPKMLTQRASVEIIWYESNRAEKHKFLEALGAQIINAILLLATIVVLTNPLFALFPRLTTFIGGPLGNVRFAINIFNCHVWLVFWPCAWFLLQSLFRQTRWLERIKLVGLIVLCVGLAIYMTKVVIWFWPWLYQQLTNRV